MEKKTENLNLRIDPKLDFAVWFAAQAAGKKKTEFAESAIRAAADQVADERGKNWRTYWDASEGVRTLRLLKYGAFETDVEDDRLLEFVDAHEAFFYDVHSDDIFNRRSVNVVWDEIESLVQEWFDTRKSNYWAVGNKMLGMLEVANVVTPTWPPHGATTDIPF